MIRWLSLHVYMYACARREREESWLCTPCVSPWVTSVICSRGRSSKRGARRGEERRDGEWEQKQEREDRRGFSIVSWFHSASLSASVCLSFGCRVRSRGSLVSKMSKNTHRLIERERERERERGREKWIWMREWAAFAFCVSEWIKLQLQLQYVYMCLFTLTE